MRYITITAKTYEEALKKARDQYSDKIRIHSRKDYLKPGFLGLVKHRRCELTCFVTENKEENENDDGLLSRFEQEAQTPAPDENPKTGDSVKKETNKENTKDKIKPLLEHASYLLTLNDFSEEYKAGIISQLNSDLEKAQPDVPDKNQFEVMILDKIAGSFNIDYANQANPPKFTVILGTTGTGKTTTTAKISALYNSFADGKRQIKIITLDSFRIGAFEQMESFGNNLGIPVFRAENRADFSDCIKSCANSDLVLIDTIGKSPRDKVLADRLSDLLSECPQDSTGYFVAVNASMKHSDIEKALDQFSCYPVRSAIITKVDETDAIGNVISACSSKNLPVLFVTDGQKVPSNIHRASTSYLMSLLNGFSADLSKITC